MAKSNKVLHKKGRGRPATGRDPVTALRLPATLTKSIEVWAARQDDKPNRSEALRRLVELGLTVKRISKGPTTQSSSSQKVRAKEMAANAIDKLTDPGASPDDKAVRKRRLLQGPSAFRETRLDRPKRK